ncbi:hypothetical protein SDC9_177762 [bioreactor metagenome]|uniref:Uncharacterized protein n=1 Tax=bioreactor metagenome TaxID=1076179 RepID=A0A645GX06_9ZZZZ
MVKVIFPDEWCELFRGSQVDFKSLEVPVVDPYYSCFCFQGKLKFFPAMDLNQRLKPFFNGKFDKVSKFFSENACNQEHEIAAFFFKLHFVNNEVFPENRQTHGFPDLSQVFERTMKHSRFGKDRDCNSTCLLHFPGKLSSCSRRDFPETLSRGCRLDFCNYRSPAFCFYSCNSGNKVPFLELWLRPFFMDIGPKCLDPGFCCVEDMENRIVHLLSLMYCYVHQRLMKYML